MALYRKFPKLGLNNSGFIFMGTVPEKKKKKKEEKKRKKEREQLGFSGQSDPGNIQRQ